MKTLIINGSPRKNGDTVALITKLKQHLIGDVLVVNTYFDNIKPCIDCRYCWKHNKCAIKDDMNKIYEFIYECDNIVIASPLYFSNLTSSILNFASRLQFLYTSRMFRKDEKILVKPKKGAILIAGGGDGSSDIAMATATIIIKQMNGNIIDFAISHNTNILPAKDDKNTLDKVVEIAKKLNDKR